MFNGGSDTVRVFSSVLSVSGRGLALSRWGESGGAVVAAERRGNADVRG